MKETILATYERKSTLWKNANAFYKAQDWVKMECLFADYSEHRNRCRVIDDNGVDITEIYWADKYAIRLTNNRGNNSKVFEFATKEEANEMFKVIKNDKNLQGWKKVN